MPIEVQCSCGRNLRVPDTAAGKRVKCPACSQIIGVPESDPYAGTAVEVAEEVYDDDDPFASFPSVPANPPSPSMGQPSAMGGASTQGAASQGPGSQERGTQVPGGAAQHPPTKRYRFAPNPNRRCHEVDFEIIGDDLQMVVIELDPGETVIAEAGAMLYMEDGIQFEAKMGDGSQPDTGMFGKVLSMGKRAISGESLFMTHFTHTGRGKSHVAFAAPYPGKIVPIDLATIPGNDLLCQKDAFLCAAMGTQVSIAFQKKLGTGLFGGEGFILQKLVGDGLACIHAGGTVIERRLNGETLRVDTGCLVAFEPHIEYNIERAGNLKSMFLGGEGLFLATLRGTGRVWLQSLPMRRLAERIVGTASGSGGSGGEGSILGSLGNLLDGD
ncbi:TIGR00266 family protein [Neorhodopirellula lusitana]|uniref:TIGR00266 family protein n=1 Tax=Neorhodopirellula lusitana TaxID=445327 RepID=A0ABY1PQN3_9BACT|nr:TIGR00266 family protein [Neorhodopirellula lusitana]